MQHVLNSNERNQAFYQFLLFFLLTTALITGAIYFNFFGVPEKEKNFYKEQVIKQRDEDLQQQKFLLYMNQAKKLLDSADKSGTDYGEVELQLNKEIIALSNIRANDSIYAQFNDVVTDAFRELKTAKKDRIELIKKDGEINKLKEELTSVKADRDRYQGLYNDQNPAVENNQ